MKNYVCALIGYGYWGQIVAKYIEENPKLLLKYVMKNDGTLIYQNILEDKEVDCIFICTPISTHYNLVKAALLNGKHVFCEKPMTKTVDEALELIEISKKTQKCLYVDYIYLQSPSINFIKEHIYLIGNIQYVKSTITQFGNFYIDDNVYEVITVHMISAVMYILNLQYSDITIENVWPLKFSESGKIVTIELLFKIKRKILWFLSSNLVSNDKVRWIEIAGEKGNIIFDMMSKDSVNLILYNPNGKGYTIEERVNYSFDENNNLKLALDDFYNCIAGSKSIDYKFSLNISNLLWDILKFEK